MSKGKVIVAGALLAIVVLVWPQPLGGDQVDVVPEASFEHPALIVQPNQTFPDPSITWDPATHVYRLYATETLWSNVPEYTSKSETGPWTFVGDALPVRPTWSKRGLRHVGARGPGHQRCLDDVGIEQVGRVQDRQLPLPSHIHRPPPARSPSIREPSAHDLNAGRRHRSDHGRLRGGLVSHLQGQRQHLPLATKFVSMKLGPERPPVGPEHLLLVSDEDWEGGMIEAPSLVLNAANGQWWVVFSAGSFSEDRSVL